MSYVRITTALRKTVIEEEKWHDSLQRYWMFLQPAAFTSYLQLSPTEQVYLQAALGAGTAQVANSRDLDTQADHAYDLFVQLSNKSA